MHKSKLRISFLYQRNGILLAVEGLSGSRGERNIEFFWLCDECAKHSTLEVTSRGVDVVPRGQDGKDTKGRFLRVSRVWRADGVDLQGTGSTYTKAA